MPFVLIGRPVQPGKITSIDTDNVGGSYEATSHLIKLGYRRIATIASNQNTSGEDRFTGYRRALAEHGLPYDEKLVAFGDYSLDSGYTAMKQLVPERPDAIYVSSDTMSIGALRLLREVNLRVPQDIAVVGHDDLPPALQADPPLTTVQQPIAQTGVRAVEMLMEIIAGKSSEPKQIVLPNKLIVRASCGAVQLG
jgi:DNA-binding LacI/PurR family transcriptional regulator